MSIRKPRSIVAFGKPVGGFIVNIACFTNKGMQTMDPERLRFLIGKALDVELGIDEEVDYTLEVRRLR